MKNQTEKTKTYSVKENPKYKDTLFRKVFTEKEDLLELYNAISGRDCKSADELDIYTLEDVLYISRKNDISFMVEGVLSLYEHQSSFNPNMPIRGLIYLTKDLEAYIAGHGINIYSSKLQRLPLPQYIVFYNGNDEMEDRIEINLKDAFVDVEGLSPCVDLKAILLNINYGHNAKILEKCRKLQEYSIFVSEVKKGVLKGGYLVDVLDEVIDRCIESGILKDILIKQRGEVRSMVLNYTLEKHQYFMRQEGRQEGINIANKLYSKLLSENRLDDLKRATEDREYQEMLIKEYGLEYE